MQSSLFLILFSFIAFASDIAAHKHHKHHKHHSECPEGVYLIVARGNGENGGPYGNVQPLVDDILGAIPNSTASPVPYPKNESIPDANGIAVQNMTDQIEEFVAMCPKGKVVLAGYSEGAGITMNTVCGTDSYRFARTPPLPESYTSNVIATIVYSDGTRVGGEPYDMGNCKAAEGQYPRHNASACDPYAAGIQSYCNSGDDICCRGGTNHKTHYTYFKKYDAKVTKFVVKQFKKSKKHHHHHGSS